jgi:predicted PurR-regulated permease PerM
MKRGNITLYITFIMLAVVIIVIAAFVAPMGVRFTSEMYAAGEKIMLDANSTIQKINNSEVRGRITNITGLALDAAESNIEINSNMFRYSWIIVLALGALIIFLYTRSLTEYQRPGGGYV